MSSVTQRIRFVAIVLFGVSVSLFGLFLLFDHYSPVDLSRVKEVSRVVKAEDGQWIYAQTNSDEKWRFPVKIEKLDPLYVNMLLTFEDRHFYLHPGVDPFAMVRAVFQMIRYGKVVSGGSTITMQLARLLNPKRRTVWAKMREIVRALQIEWHYSKDQILESYLTLTPYGGNIEGVVAASMHYFGKLPNALSAAESALLVSLPQSPEKNRPDRYPKRAAEARNKVLTISKKRDIISETLFRQAITEHPSGRSYAYPRYAPHLSQKLLSDPSISGKEITTTLDRSLQQQLELWAQSKSPVLEKDTTIAVLVIRNSDAAIEAYLGSHNMFSSRVSGYVDMVQALRSPGSTLKPFIYALGFEKHLIHPNTLIMDRETRFGDYMPHNFSRKYRGEVTIAYALQHSLNIPAVKVLQRIGVVAFTERISRIAGKIKTLKERATLPVALGGIGMTMMQISQLYVALANGGKTAAIHDIPLLSDRNGSKKSLYLCSPKAAKMTTSVLRNIPAPAGFVDTQKQIAYKTGTSYGYRDAWTFSYNKTHTVAVWVGKPSNATQLKLTGRSTAAPMAFELFSLLDNLLPQHTWEWPSSYLGNRVPVGLSYFDPRESLHTEKHLTMLYPRENTRFKSADCSDTVVEVKVEDGKRPYFWYVDGKPYDADRATSLLHFEYGAHTITVIDSSGDTIVRNIWVDKPEC